MKDIKSLEPQNWEEMRALGHQMIDDVMDFLQNIKQRPSWQAIPKSVKQYFDEDIPETPQAINEIYEAFKTYILPYPKGNIHPRFFA